MEKEYEKPEVEIITLDEDIITTSGPTLCTPSDAGFVPDP